MASKKELQTILKGKYGINKNISKPLTADDCERLLILLEKEPSALNLVNSFIEKNEDLGKNNQHCGLLRTNSEKKLKKLQLDYQKIEAQIAAMEQAKEALMKQKRVVTNEVKARQADIKRLAAEKQHLTSKAEALAKDNSELFEANTYLKKDNRDLKNTVDQIRLKLAQRISNLLEYEDSELRRALLTWFRGTLG